MGIVYLSPTVEIVGSFGVDFDILIEVETGDLKLTAFEDCKEWEVLCWGAIPRQNILRVWSLREIVRTFSRPVVEPAVSINGDEAGFELFEQDSHTR
jgi:hypothetical protein